MLQLDASHPEQANIWDKPHFQLELLARVRRTVGDPTKVTPLPTLSLGAGSRRPPGADQSTTQSIPQHIPASENDRRRQMEHSGVPTQAPPQCAHRMTPSSRRWPWPGQSLAQIRGRSPDCCQAGGEIRAEYCTWEESPQRATSSKPKRTTAQTERYAGDRERDDGR